MAMAELPWRDNLKLSSTVLLASTGAFALLDAVTRPGVMPTTMLALGVALLVLAIVALVVPWRPRGTLVRLIPAVVVVAAILVAVFVGDVGEAPGAPVGLTITAILVMVQIGVATSPGQALVFSPILLAVLLVAYWENPARLNLALPLLAVPFGALLAELVASLEQRQKESSQANLKTTEQLIELQRILPRFGPNESTEDAARQIGRVGRQVFGATRSTVVLRDRANGLVTATDGPADVDVDLRVAGMLAEAIGGREPQVIRTDGRNECFLVIPLPADDVAVGAVVLHPVRGESDTLRAMAALFAAQVAASVSHLHVIEELAEATRVDELTGIGNRRHADDLLASLGSGDALILIDVDGFKNVNDTYGHPVGDQLLQTLSAHLRACLRDSDTSARLGGDEFLVVARRAHADPMTVADRILDGWVERRPDIGNVTPTLSAGVALHEAGRSSAETYDRADRALLQAKRKGKNQARLWDTDDRR